MANTSLSASADTRPDPRWIEVDRAWSVGKRSGEWTIRRMYPSEEAEIIHPLWLDVWVLAKRMAQPATKPRVLVAMVRVVSEGGKYGTTTTSRMTSPLLITGPDVYTTLECKCAGACRCSGLVELKQEGIQAHVDRMVARALLHYGEAR